MTICILTNYDEYSEIRGTVFSLVSFRFFGAFIEAWLGGSIAFLVVFGGLWVGSVLSKVHAKLIL